MEKSSNTFLAILKVYSDITSYIAAGFFRPDADVAPDLDTAERWYRDTFERWIKLEKLNTPRITGVKKVPGAMIFEWETVRIHTEAAPAADIRARMERKTQFYISIMLDARFTRAARSRIRAEFVQRRGHVERAV